MSDAFACIAQVGTGGGGSPARPWPPPSSRRSTTLTTRTRATADFLRDDALLVVTIIQDDYDEDSLGTVDEWIEALRASKKYDDDAFMVLVLTTDVDVGFDQLCHPDEWNPNKNRLRLLAEGVKHGFIGSICMDNYAEFFKEHVGPSSRSLRRLRTAWLRPHWASRVMHPHHGVRHVVARPVPTPSTEAPRVTGDCASSVVARNTVVVVDAWLE
jgi:hypothetical protein